ncbi:MAG: hypothetical protein WBH85_16495 [Thermoanaerobaculia bacterium]
MTMKESSYPHRRLACLAALLWLGGCAGFSNPDAVTEHVSQVTGVAYERQGGLTVGRSAVQLARLGVTAAGQESPAMLENLKDIQVGVYRASGATSEVTGRSLRVGDFSAYEPVVALQAETGEDILLLSRLSRGTIRELLLVIHGGEGLTVVQLRGDLEDLLEEAVKLAFGRAERPDLAAATLDSLAAPSSEP